MPAMPRHFAAERLDIYFLIDRELSHLLRLFRFAVAAASPPRNARFADHAADDAMAAARWLPAMLCHAHAAPTSIFSSAKTESYWLKITPIAAITR